MFSLKELLPSLLSATFVMLVSSVVKELIPPVIRDYLFAIFRRRFTFIIKEKCDLDRNEIFEAATTYLRSKVTSDSTKCLEASKTIRQKKPTFDIAMGQEVLDRFGNIELKWKLMEKGDLTKQNRQVFFELSFEKKFEEIVRESYFPEIIRRSETIKKEEEMVKLYSRESGCLDGRAWRSVNLEHPATFEKLAMEPELKKMVKDDLDRFVRRKELYKKVGKAWKRGYLIYGPPGTGKSSLIAAMANYLKFNIYDLNLSGRLSDLQLRKILLSTSNRSILVIEFEDIDRAAELNDRERRDELFTLSGLLNIIDGLWSSCGDERIIVFTTYHKDRLDPALLCPGRKDLHVHMSYCTMDGFKLLTSNYLDINGDHQLYRQIEGLLANVEVTPAEIAEELLKSSGNSDDVVLAGLVKFFKQKKLEKAKAAKVKELLKSGDTDVDVEGFVKFLKQKKLENAKAAEAWQLFSDDIDVDVDVDEGFVKLLKRKYFDYSQLN
ncbi:AAA-ATPase At2g18193-like [Quercus lobata]|uniref:AAA-ATPase At2g18193-like n=1 Tax=Quercus lobata TaxID=97700 RepID=UPI001245B72C|nr:AAA-ATPase At2g18193-like [Quercus lobata]